MLNLQIRATKWWVDESNDYRRDAHADGITAAPFMLEQFQRDLELLLAGKDPWV